jgi:anti-sigma factor RsiW
MFDKLSDYIDGDLDEPTRRQIEEHTAVCTDCKICLATLKKTVTLCNSLANDPVPEAFHSKLKATLLQNIATTPPGTQKR